MLGSCRGTNNDGEIHPGLRMGVILGKGGYGTVFRGVWYGTPVAVKLVEQYGGCKGASSTSVGSTVEALMGAELRHPNIVATLKVVTQTPVGGDAATAASKDLAAAAVGNGVCTQTAMFSDDTARTVSQLLNPDAVSLDLHASPGGRAWRPPTIKPAIDVGHALAGFETGPGTAAAGGGFVGPDQPAAAGTAHLLAPYNVQHMLNMDVRPHPAAANTPSVEPAHHPQVCVPGGLLDSDRGHCTL